MKKQNLLTSILLLLIILMIAPAIGITADVSLKWEHNDPVPEGYSLFIRDVDQGYDYSNPAWTGLENQANISNLVNGQTYAFVVRAFEGELQSADSNEVIYTIPDEKQVIVYPKQPKQLLIMFGD